MSEKTKTQVFIFLSSGWKWYPIPLASGDYGGLPIQDYALESNKEGNPVVPVMKLGFSFARAILFKSNKLMDIVGVGWGGVGGECYNIQFDRKHCHLHLSSPRASR